MGGYTTLPQRRFICRTQKTFKRREGHCRVPIRHREGDFRLGHWVSTQRKKRTDLPDVRKRRLKKIGFVWRERQGYGRAMEIKDAL
jgi:hypothetical protein